MSSTPKKFKKPNGFMIYTFEWMRQNKFEGSLQSAIKITGELWPKFDEERQQAYRNKAQKKNKCSNDVPMEKKYSDDSIMKLNIYLEVFLDFNTKRFIIICCHNSTSPSHEGCDISTEIAAVEFTLQNGITKVFHRSVDAQGVYSSATNHLSAPPDASEETYLKIMYEELREFVKERNEYRPLYTAKNQIEKVKNLLTAMSYSEKIEDKMLTISSMEYLTNVLKNYFCDEFITRNLHIENMFKLADYNKSKISCEAHKKTLIKYCALSIASSWAMLAYNYISNREGNQNWEDNMRDSEDVCKSLSTLPSSSSFGINISVIKSNDLREQKCERTSSELSETKSSNHLVPVYEPKCNDIEIYFPKLFKSASISSLNVEVGSESEKSWCAEEDVTYEEIEEDEHMLLAGVEHERNKMCTQEYSCDHVNLNDHKHCSGRDYDCDRENSCYNRNDRGRGNVYLRSNSRRRGYISRRGHVYSSRNYNEGGFANDYEYNFVHGDDCHREDNDHNDDYDYDYYNCDGYENRLGKNYNNGNKCDHGHDSNDDYDSKRDHDSDRNSERGHDDDRSAV